ncbi:MAG TPA: YHS domain-containing protein [Candidatus Dormibacteraeota bacterium]|nr:YHS domain-containing protein [Candidatus Dormibacteraeota bacterium]
MIRAHARRPADTSRMVQDPVCGMSVDPATATQRVDYHGHAYFFCSASCRSTFEREPERYVAASGDGSRPPLPLTTTTGGEMETRKTAIDPVCGMTVETATAEYRSFRNGETFYFCSAGCKESFDKDPARYLSGKSGGHHGH